MLKTSLHSKEMLQRLEKGKAGPDILLEIESRGEAGCIPSILQFVVDSKDRRVADVAAQVVSGLVSRLRAAQYVQLDQYLRDFLSGYQSYRAGGWAQLTPNQLSQLERFGDAFVPLVGLASCHRSGHVREEAVRLLGQPMDSRALPFLLIRFNDWVPQVRWVARRATAPWVNAAHAFTLVRFVPLVDRLQYCSRDDHSTILHDMRNLVSSNPQALLEGTSSPDSQVRRLSFRWLLELEGGLSPDLIRMGLNNPDVVVRLQVARKARVLPPDALALVLPMLRSSPQYSIRREALYIIAMQQGREAIIPFLLDRSRSVREAARYHVGEMDFAGYYRKALASGACECLGAAVSGLGETGQKADAALVTPFMRHSSVFVGKAAIMALARLDGEGQAMALLEVVRNEVPGLSKAATEALCARPLCCRMQDIWALLEAPGPRHVKKNALALIDTGSKWKRLPWLLRACSHGEGHVAGTAQALLSTWVKNYNVVQIPPSREEIAEAGRALNEHAGSVHRELHDKIHALLSDWARNDRLRKW